MTAIFPGLCAIALFSQESTGRTPFADFEAGIASYMQIHKAAEADLGALSSTRSPKQLDDKKNSIAEGVRAKRAHAAQGDLFTPAIATEFRKLIAMNVKKRPGRIRTSIRSGEQVAPKIQVNGPYPEGQPLQTMPPTLLESFPKLPPELDYRFVGSTLVLRDVTANLIIDLIPNAIALH